MARLPLGPPPTPGARATFRDFRRWLEYAFFDRMCAYCQLPDASVEIDHVEPRRYAPHRTHDPTNLVLACPRCNGRGGKGDYHPEHTARTRRPHDTTGFAVLDVRHEDPAALLQVHDDGAITARDPGPEGERARWLIALLKLRSYKRREHRRELLDLALACELLHRDREAGSPEAAAQLALLMPWLARRLRFFEAFDRSLSPALRAELEALRAVLRETEVGSR